MKKITKTVLSLALCLSLVLGSSVSSMAASGIISLNNFKVVYITAATGVKLTTTGFYNNSYVYAVKANAYEVSKDGVHCKIKSFEQCRGIGATSSSLVASVQPDSGYTFKTSTQFNNGRLMRGKRVDCSDLATLYNFKYSI